MTTPETHFSVPRSILKLASTLTASAATVYLRLAELAGAESGCISLSTSVLASRTGLSRRVVFTALAELERTGLIDRCKTRPTGIAVFHLVVSELGRDARSMVPGEQQRTEELAPAGPSYSRSGLLNENDPAPIEQLLSRAYSASCQLTDLQALVDLPDGELRRCLEELAHHGGVSGDSPLAFFAAAVRTTWRQLYGMPPARQSHLRPSSYQRHQATGAL